MTKPKEAQLDLLLKISEGLSKRSYEMLQVSPTDAIHVPSCGLAIRDAVDELRWMRVEIEKLRAAIQSLAERLEVDPSGTDKIDDLEAENERLRADLALEKSRIVLQRGEIERLRADVERLRTVYVLIASRQAGPVDSATCWYEDKIIGCYISREAAEGAAKLLMADWRINEYALVGKS